MKILCNFITFQRSYPYKNEYLIQDISFVKLFKPQVKPFRFKNKICLKKLCTCIYFLMILDRL